MIDELRNLNFEYIAILPVFTDVPDLKITKDDYPKLQLFYKEQVDYFFYNLINDKKPIYLPDVINILSTIIFKKYLPDCSAGESVCISPKGDIYPCQMFYVSKSKKLGNIKNLNKDEFIIKCENINSVTRFNVKNCENCVVRYSCGVWCRGANFNTNGTIESVIPFRCFIENTILDSVLLNLSELQLNKEAFSKFIANLNIYAKNLKNIHKIS